LCADNQWKGEAGVMATQPEGSAEWTSRVWRELQAGGYFQGVLRPGAALLQEIAVGAGPGAPGGHVKVFDGQTGLELLSFFAFDPNFTGGVRVAAGDVDGDKIPEIITGAGIGAQPHVKVFRAIDLLVLHNFLAYEPDFLGGVFVAGA